MRIAVPAWIAAAFFCLLVAPVAHAQDAKGAKPLNRMTVSALGAPRTSPFNPPDKDIFLTDASPGLDTGCTFNTSPLNPLTIDVVIDRFVGDVDGSGYLVNPAPLISAGILPAGVDIILPAYDVDYNGVAPPERDELLFNGESLGFLTGDNNVWKLNTFRVDIRKIKFPQRPAPGAAPTPVSNRVQIRIDTLSSERWCTSIDWVALVVPVRPKLALDLEVLAGNPVRSLTGAAITKIQEQTFDASCNVTTAVGPYDQYPFSGPATSGAGGGTAKLRAKIKTCPQDSIQPPKVDADWSVAGTPQKGTTSWTGLEGTVEYAMPANVGAYSAELKLALDNGQTLTASRKLFVTKRAPLVADPRINWYERGTDWASGQSDDTVIVQRVLAGVYAFGTANWRYGYFPGKCNWQDLVNSPITCNYSDCYVFSDVLENISGVLGVGGMTAIKEFGRNAMGFITNGSPSLDPAFRGNTRQVGTAAYNRYLFSSHSLRLRGGTYYDATFNGQYATQQQFISFHINGTSGTDVLGTWMGTDEGKRVYVRAGSVYDSWGKNEYAFLTRSPYGLLASLGQPLLAAGATPLAGPGLISFPGSARFRTVDADADGRFDALEADVDLDIVTAGDYVVFARLDRGGLLVANRPAFESMLVTRADVGGAPGRRTVTLRFSGEQIRRSGLDGPYTLSIAANSDTAGAGTASLATPAYNHNAFGETKALLRSLIPTPVDADGSGKYEAIRLDASAEVAVAGNYQLRASIGSGGVDLGGITRALHLDAGNQPITLSLPAAALARSGRNGPYDVTLSLIDAAGATLDSAAVTTGALLAAQFEGLVEVSPSLVEQLVDSNANGLYDLLRVSADVSARAARNVSVVARLVGINGAAVSTETIASLMAGTQRVSFEFLGPQIRRMQMDSQYTLELSFRDPATLAEIDALRVPLRGAYLYTKFDSSVVPRAIALNGTHADHGIDSNGNTLFDQLSVDLGVELATAGFYEWSARLVDKAGTEIGFATGRGSLGAGTTSIQLLFDGRPIGQNGFDGPYFIRSLLMAGPGGANLVSTFAGETSALKARQFEGYTARLPGDINGDGVVNAADIDAFNRALGSSIGEPAYNSFADFDRDGRVTLNDLRIFRSFLRR